MVPKEETIDNDSGQYRLGEAIRLLVAHGARQLADGLAACIATAELWPPTLPQFGMMCLGIPPFDAVRPDARQQDGFTKLVWHYLEGHRYRLASA
jgi:hypothetical protein